MALAHLLIIFLVISKQAAFSFSFVDRRPLSLAAGSKQRKNVRPFHLCKTIVMKRAPEINEGPDRAVVEKMKKPIEAKRPVLGHVVPQTMRRQMKDNANRSQSRRAKGGSSSPRLRPQGQTRDQTLNNPSNLRILAGSARGRRLSSPSVYLRPMMGKVRAAVFSTLTSFGLYEAVAEPDECSPTRHLDIFSGSGSVGLESLSRGASQCVFVDLAQDCCETAEKNLEVCDLSERGQVKCCDAFVALRQPESIGLEGQTFDLVTICPPYEEVVYADLLEAVATSPCVREDTIILVEYPIELGCLPHVLDHSGKNGNRKMVGLRNRRYGRTVIAMYIVNPSGRLENAESRPEEFISV